MRRREFIAGLGGAAALPLAARAQQVMPVVGYLDFTSSRPDPIVPPAFRTGLAVAGFVEGRNVTIEARFAGNQGGRLAQFAAELVEHRVAVIVAIDSGPTVLAAKAATSTIPIVFSIATDPIKFGLVASLNRPGGNMTGVTVLSHELTGKRLDLLCRMVAIAHRRPGDVPAWSLISGPVGIARCPRADRRHNGRPVEGQCMEAPPLSRGTNEAEINGRRDPGQAKATRMTKPH